ncbi:MAG: tetratricopeptide repeat protein [Leptospirillia bacterium]
MKGSMRKAVAGVLLTAGLIGVTGCNLPYVKKFMAHERRESQEDARFKKDYRTFTALVRNNSFRQALAWVEKWEKVRNLSDDNRRRLKSDEKTVRMLGSAYYMGMAKERTKRGRFHAALEALHTARFFTPSDSELTREIERAKARIIVSGESGQDWGEVVQKLLALKRRNPQDHAVDPPLGWAYSKLAQSEYTAGRLPMAYEFVRQSLTYDGSNDGALQLRDRIARKVELLVQKAERAYRQHDLQSARDHLTRALEIDPQNKKASEDWKILGETPGETVSPSQTTP